MNFKTTYLLFGLLAVLLVVFAVALWKGEPASDNTLWVLPGMHSKASPFNTDEVDRVTIERSRPGQETIVFERDPEGKGWRITQPRPLRADAGHINELIRQVHDARREEQADRPSGLKEWGLAPPAEVVTLHGQSGREVKLFVGDSSPGPADDPKAVLYVSSSDKAGEGMAVAKGTLDSVLKGLRYFRGKDLLGSGTGDIQAVTLSEEKKGPVGLKKTGAGRWRFEQPPYGDAEVEGAAAAPTPGKAPGSVSALLTGLTDLRVAYKDDKDNDFVADDVRDLSRYNLGPKDRVLRIAVVREEGNSKTRTTTLLVGAGKKAAGKVDKYYARLEDEKDVVRVSAQGVEPLLKLLDDPGVLRDRSLVDLGGSFRQPDALDVKNSYGELEFRRPDLAKPWRLYRGGKEREVSDQAVSQLVNTLTQRDQVKSFPDPGRKAALGLDNPEKAQAVVKVWAEGIAPEEKKDKKDEKEKKQEQGPAKPKLKDPDRPNTALYFGNRESGNVAVLRKKADDKEGTLVMVPEAVLDLVKQGPLAYLDKALPQYAPGSLDAAKDVTRLELERDGKKYVIAKDQAGKEKGGSGWKIEKPADLAGRSADPRAVENILNTLNRLQAQKLVAEKAEPAQLEREYGLKPAAVKAVVTLKQDGKEKRYEYDFGKEAEGGVYGKQSQSDLVFVANREVLTTLQGQLQDPTVFRFDANKVKSIKMTGWKDLLGSTLTLELEKGGSEWKAKSPKDFKLDAGKLQRFLRELSALRAERFVAHDAAPKPEQGLDMAQGALAVEVGVEGRAEPLQLTVGKQDGPGSYFATSKQLPKEIFEVRKDVFEGPKGKPAYFSP